MMGQTLSGLRGCKIILSYLGSQGFDSGLSIWRVGKTVSRLEPGIVVHGINLNTWEAEAGGRLIFRPA